MMRDEIKGDWSGYYPKTNIMVGESTFVKFSELNAFTKWIYYLIDKLLTSKPTLHANMRGNTNAKALKKSLEELRQRVLNYLSITMFIEEEIMKNEGLFSAGFTKH
jgi:hypothetical protein